jgi:anti-repressor protein
MSALAVFEYAGTQLRTVLIDGGPWFVGADVLALCDLNRSSLALLDDDEKGVHSVDTLGGTQQMTIVSEAGLYSLILRSRKSETKAIKRWITHKVLPQIRRTGSYGSPQVDVTQIDRRALALMVIEAEDRAAALALENEAMRPKADLADAFLAAAPGNWLVREVAKSLGMQEKALRAFLLEERLVFVRHALCGAVQYDHRGVRRSLPTGGEGRHALVGRLLLHPHGHPARHGPDP